MKIIVESLKYMYNLLMMVVCNLCFQPFQSHPGFGVDQKETNSRSTQGKIFCLISYLQRECVEKWQFKLCSKCDREHDFGVMFG